MNANEALLAALRRERLVPDQIDAFPGDEVSAKYGGVPVSPGGKLSVEQTASAPDLEWSVPDGESAAYAVLMFDVDAPSRSTSHGLCWLHWAVGDIPGLDIARGSEIVPYAGPTPPKGSGPHRYVLVVYRQAEEMGVRQLGRPKFDPLRFAHSQELEPIAANFFVAENE